MWAWIADSFQHHDSLFDWQTLVAGGLAILAALIGGAYISSQTRVSREIEVDRNTRKLDAALAVLPLTLSTLDEYLQDCFWFLEALLSSRIGETIPKVKKPLSPPQCQAALIEGLRATIEYSDQPLRGVLKMLVQRLQIQIATLNSLVEELREDRFLERTVTAANIENQIVLSAEIYARSDALLLFARGENGAVPGGPMQADIQRALNQNGYWQEAYPRISEQVCRTYRQ